MSKHIMKNGKLIKIHKKFSDLSTRQQEFIREILKKLHLQYNNIGLKRGKVTETVLLAAQNKLDEREICLPLSELKKIYFSCKQKWNDTKS